MCGITGYFHTNEITYSEDVILNMTNAIKHRGPDAQKFLNLGNAAFGHTRLSIIDLSEEANQPFFSDDNNYILVFNGEIFNFLEIQKELIALGINFKTKSDTEVLLKAFIYWGEVCLNKLNGFFAFSIYNKITQELFIARDRVGVKPMYYFNNSGFFVFASEIKSLIQHPEFKKEINTEALADYLQHQVIYKSGDTIYKNVYHLLPGHFIKISKNKFTISQFWNLSQSAIDLSMNVKEKNTAILEQLIEDAVKIRMISDVPLGAFLSGGIDSSLIALFMQKNSAKPIKTFTIGFENSAFDESLYAKKVSDILGTEHYCEILNIDDAKKTFFELFDYFDEPFADSSALPTFLLSKITKKHVTVALSGDGGDELFHGYERYYHTLNREEFLKKLPFKNIALRKTVINNLPESSFKRFLNFSSDYNKTKNKLDLYNWTLSNDHSSVIKRLLKKDFVEGNSIINFDKIIKKESDIDLFAECDFYNYLPKDILAKVDRMSMANQLETRNPLLDYRVVELAFSMSHEEKKGKIQLKQILAKYFPSEIFERKKAGFSIPLEQWLKTDFSFLIEEYLNKEFIVKQGIFNFDEINKQVSLFNKKSSYNYNLIWTILAFQMWYEKWIK